MLRERVMEDDGVRFVANREIAGASEYEPSSSRLKYDARARAQRR